MSSERDVSINELAEKGYVKKYEISGHATTPGFRSDPNNPFASSANEYGVNVTKTPLEESLLRENPLTDVKPNNGVTPLPQVGPDLGEPKPIGGEEINLGSDTPVRETQLKPITEVPVGTTTPKKPPESIIVKPGNGEDNASQIAPTYPGSSYPSGAATLLMSRSEIESLISKLNSARQEMESIWNDIKTNDIQKINESWAGADCAKYIEKINYLNIEASFEAITLLVNAYTKTLSKVDEMQNNLVYKIESQSASAIANSGYSYN